MEHFKNSSRAELIKIIEVYAKNWLAHDGSWFLAAEDKFGMDTAIELDKNSWERFAVSEARRIIKEFDIQPNGGLKSLEKAFKYRLYAAINPQSTEWKGENRLIFKMNECRVQKLRRGKGLPDFPCKTVGIVEFTQFAKTIDPRIKTKCIACPPDEVMEYYCEWEFTIEK